MDPTGIYCVIPSRLKTGEKFDIKVKVLGPLRKIECRANWSTRNPALHGPFNYNVERQIQYLDNCLPAWEGRLIVDGGSALIGDRNLEFDGKNQGVLPKERRPIKIFPDFRFKKPGFQFIKLTDKSTGLIGWSNPCHVTAEAPAERIFWGDPHWHTIFSDAIRCPEELYAFARYEGFLDFGGITDHIESLSDQQWLYFQNVADACNKDGVFTTLIGQEWTNHKEGHRNIYFRKAGGPALRSTDPRYDGLTKLRAALDALPEYDPIVIPHHSANRVMGVDWSLGWNRKYEKAVEIHSVWGNSECHANDGNPMPIEHSGGEVRGQHVVDALRLGYRFGFVGGGDVHDGRPGDGYPNESFPPQNTRSRPSGFTAAIASSLTREAIYDAIKNRRTYASTQSRIYLEVSLTPEANKESLFIRSASEEGIRHIVVVRNGDPVQTIYPQKENRVLEQAIQLAPLQQEEFLYLRLHTDKGNMAWSSPFRPHRR